MPQLCPECGAAWQEGKTCQDDFYQMLYWEAEDPSLGEVHHLTVLCYHLQHPSLYSSAGLEGARQMLAQFVDQDVNPGEIRNRNSSQLDSGKRNWKIKGAPASHGSYNPPVRWSMTASDVVAAGREHYCEAVKAWARSVYETLKDAGKSAAG